MPITGQVLGAVGIPDGNQPRTLAALRFLGLVDEEGNSTEMFDRVTNARTEEYTQILAEIIRNAYNPVFTMVDPAQDSDIAIYDAFRQYHPEAQRQRMVSLFRALCEEAEIIERGTRPRAVRTGDGPRTLRATTPSPRSKVSLRGTQPASTGKLEVQRVPNQAGADTIFGLTADDIGLLGEADFNEVWQALGKVAWARGQAKSKQADTSDLEALSIEDSPESYHA